jgi:Spy/CpxP family protein refolding chaperone
MKSSRMKWMGAALALTLLAVVAVCETTGPAHRHRGEMFGGPMVRVFARQLNLTDAQRTQIHQILAKEKPTVQPLMRQMAQSRYQIAQLELNGAFDESQVRPLASQQAQTMSDLIVQRARIESELIQVLTPDQKTKLTQILATHEQRLQSHSQGQTPSQ